MSIKISEQEYLGTIIQMLDISFTVKEAVILAIRDLHMIHGRNITVPKIKNKTRRAFYQWIDVLIAQDDLLPYENMGDI